MISINAIWARVLRKILNPPAVRTSNIDKSSKICSASNIVNVKLGKYSYIGNNCTVVNASIGSFCSIADYCNIGGARHLIEWASTSPVFHRGRNILGKNFSNHSLKEQERILIGNDVWIGSMCLIKEGVQIGNGAVIGMGSVVTKNVDPYTIVAGNPARPIRKRFEQEVIQKIEATHWWDLKDSDLKEVSKYINDLDGFFKTIAQIRQENQ